MGPRRSLMVWVSMLLLSSASFAQVRESRVFQNSGALGVCEMELVDPVADSLRIGYDIQARVFPSMVACKAILPLDCKVKLLGKLISSYVLGVAGETGWSMKQIVDQFYNIFGFRSYARWECFEIPGGDNVISDPKDYPEFTKDWEPIRVPEIPPDVNLDHIRERYPRVDFPGLGWQMAINLVRADQWGLVEETVDHALVFTAAGALAYAGYSLATRQAMASTLFSGLRAVPLPVAALIAGSIVLTSSSRAYENVDKAPWIFPELPKEQQDDIHKNYPAIVAKLRRFDEALSHMIELQAAKGFSITWPASSPENPIYQRGDRVRFTMPKDADRIEVRLYDLLGKEVDQKTYFNSSLDWEVLLPVDSMKPGLHYLSMLGFGASNQVEYSKVVKLVYLKGTAVKP